MRNPSSKKQAVLSIQIHIVRKHIGTAIEPGVRPGHPGNRLRQKPLVLGFPDIKPHHAVKIKPGKQIIVQIKNETTVGRGGRVNRLIDHGYWIKNTAFYLSTSHTAQSPLEIAVGCKIFHRSRAIFINVIGTHIGHFGQGLSPGIMPVTASVRIRKREIGGDAQLLTKAVINTKQRAETFKSATNRGSLFLQIAKRKTIIGPVSTSCHRKTVVRRKSTLRYFIDVINILRIFPEINPLWVKPDLGRVVK